jgi:hypothetical protein
MSPFPVEIYGHILAQLPPLRGSDSSVFTLVNCSETNSILRYIAASAALWGPHYQIRYKHSSEREEVRKSRFKSDWRALYFERRRLESQVLAMMKDIILGNVGSTVEERSEEEEEREASGALATGGRKVHRATWNGRMRCAGHSTEDRPAQVHGRTRRSGTGVRKSHIALEELGDVLEGLRPPS